MPSWVYIFDLIGTGVFALTGAIGARRYRMDPFGILVLAAVTAVGGGSIRDALMGATPVFWMLDINYLIVILITVLLSFPLLSRPAHLPQSTLLIADACGLALFTVIGTEKALVMGFSGMVAVIMGLVTGVGGGIIRDLLCRQVPLILRTEIYATASILGGICFSIGYISPLNDTLVLFIAMCGSLGLRLAAIRWQLSLPVFGLSSKR